MQPREEQEHTATILLVDDNPANLGVLFDSLTQQNFRVLLAQDGEKGVSQAKRVRPDIILLDVLMPKMDGFETCRQLKANAETQDIPVIFMTALSDTVDKVRGFEVGGVDYITKPLQHEEVIARVNTHLTIRRLQRQLQEQNVLLQEKNEILEQHKQELKALNASKDKFFSIIAHDLRSPFTGFLGVTHYVADNIDAWGKDKLRQVAKMLQDSAENLYALLGNLLTWASIQRDVLEYAPEELDMYETIERTVQLFKPTADQKKIALRMTVSESARAVADKQMVGTILRNLISNALKFTRPEGEVIITAQEQDDLLEIAVSDSGIGITADALSKIFRLDTKYQKIGTSGERGTGLGLLLCKELVEMQGGSISVESEPDQGTTFTFTLTTSPHSQPFEA